MRVLLAVLAATCASLTLVGGAASGGRQLKVGLVLETVAVGSVDDPFQSGPVHGLQRAIKEFGVQGRLMAPTPNQGWLPAFSYLARHKYDLIIGLGLLEAHDLAVAARRFPDQKFAILDAPFTKLPHRPKNVAGTIFKSEQAAYLAGYLAARMERRAGGHVISSVGGLPIASVDSFIAGFQAGAKRADPNITTLNAYSQDFINGQRCRRVALDQIARGSGVVFDVAGSCGLGALQAAKEKGVFGIGVDIDQSYLGAFILTSVVKRYDLATYDLVRRLQQGKLAGGRDAVFDLHNNGIGLGKVSSRVPRSLRRELARLRARIVAGKISVPARLK